MKIAPDRLSLRWYLGYDLHEQLPDHSSLTKIRERYGLLDMVPQRGLELYSSPHEVG